MNIWTIILFLFINAQVGLSNDDGPLLTQTIYGFLDFTTTIGNTVMVFSPQSAPALVLKPEIIAPVIKTKPENVAPIITDDAINPTKLKTVNTKSKTQGSSKGSEHKLKPPNALATTSTPASAPVPVTVPIPQNVAIPNEIVKTSLTLENDVQDPEYDLLSRQPPQFIEETYRVVNLKSNSKNSRTPVVVTPEKNTASSIVLSSKAPSRSHKNKKNKVRPSSTLQVLKTAAPVTPQKNSISNKVTLRNTSSSSTSSTSTSRKSSKKGSSHRGTTSTTPQPEEVVIVKSTTTRNKPKRKNKHKNSSTTSKPRYSTTTSSTTTEQAVRRAFRPKLQVTNSDLDSNNNLHITKLNRTPGRWQYKTSPKPRINIRKPAIEANGPVGLNNVTSSANSNSNVFADTALSENINGNFLNQNVIYNQTDLEISGSQNGPILNNIDQEGKQKVFTETINVEISTPADFKDTYYEIATIKKPFIFQAGVLKKTRFITVTSTIEKYLTPEPSIEPRNDDEPLTENILAATTKAEGVLVGSITTLPPIYVNGESDTPILQTITESFSIVNKKLKTQILPVINENDNETTYHTLVQTIDLTSLITVTKTTSPQLETKEFNGFKDFVGNLDEAGSEINLDLEFGDEGNQENGSGESHKNDFDGARFNKTTQQIQPTFSTGVLNLPSQNVITNSRPVVKLETLWESYVVPITNGQSTTFRTLSKAKGVVEKTDYVIETTTLSVPPPILPPSTINPFLLNLPQQFQTITSPVVHQTIVTQTESKILKLTFGAKTAYTTLYSTQVVPTLQTMYVTTSVPVQPTANPFQGFFPQPYNPFAYLG
ncbi:mucin-2 [Calliphora vicina]|uniref:mucin-2 n=1 Tax=Calliphora vicina TaxID=7373 RepID=UPI00325B9567